MSSGDPQPVDIDGQFSAVATNLIQQLKRHRDAIRPEEQLQLLRQTLTTNPWLLATLEDPEWQKSIREACVPVASEQHDNITSDIGNQIAPGDVLNVSYYKLPHKVLVESCSYSGPEQRLVVQAIHYGRIGILHPVTVMREEFQLPCNGSSAWLHKFPNSVTYTAEETLARARSRLGERQHHPTANNASSMALWCRVRDHQRNRSSLTVPMCDDNGKEVHQLMPADHIDLSILNRQLHAVVSAVQSFDETNHWRLLTVVALRKEVAILKNNGLCSFKRISYEMSSGEKLERLQVPFQMNDVRKAAQRLDGTSLCWECNELQAMSFLATGVTAEPKGCPQSTIEVDDILPGNVIVYRDRFQFVLSVQRPERPDQTHRIETVQYAPLQLDDAHKTSELRLLMDLSKREQVLMVRHSEPDLQCSILMSWKFVDSPLVTENAVCQVADLKPGDAVCIREDTTAHPFVSTMPGLHAIVKSVDSSGTEDNGGPSLEVICYIAGEDMPTVGVRRVPVSGHKFSTLRYHIHEGLLSSREQALQRAMIRLGTGQYCSSWSNSRDLVRWCCVNHKANAPTFLGQVKNVSDLLALPTLGQGRLRLQQLEISCGSSQFRDVRLISAMPSDDSVDLVKLTVSDVHWQPSCVRLVEVEALSTARLSRLNHAGDEHGQNRQHCASIVSALLEASLVNASDRRLGAGVTDRDFCTWMRRTRRPGLSELPVLLSADAHNPDPDSREGDEPVLDPGNLNAWDHVVIEKPRSPPLHLLVLDFNADSGVLRGYTYGPGVESHDPSKQLNVYMYLPPYKSPLPMHKVILRSSADDEDASSQLSASLAAASHFPDDAAAWTQMAVLELESDLLLQKCKFRKLLKSMLLFALRVSAKEVLDNDDSLQACKQMLASDGFAGELKSRAEELGETSGRRLYFLAQLIACLLEATAQN